MIRKLLLLCTFILFSVFSFGQSNQNWKWLHEKPQGNQIRWMKAWDATNWYAVGAAGTFMKTSDAGATWFFHHQASRPTSTTLAPNILYGAYFFSKDTGFVVGANSSIYKTVNGGLTFDTVAVLPPSCTFYNIYFVSRTVGYVCGTTTAGRFMQTTDGGATWTLNATVPAGSYYDLWVNGSNIILSSTAGNVQRSTDGGTTWGAVLTGASATLYKLNFINATTGMVVGSTSAARLTTDAGATWTAITTLPASQTFYDCDYAGGNWYVTGNSYYIFRSTNNGTSWDSVSILAPVASQPWTSTYYATDINGSLIIAGGGFGLINSKVGSANAVCLTTFKRAGAIYDVWGNNSGRIITVGAPSTTGIYDQIMVSTDNGTSWIFPTVNKGLTRAVHVDPVEEKVIEEKGSPEYSSPTSTATFRCLKMVDDNIGYTCGTNGAVYKTTNGGLAWDSLTTPIASTHSLYKLDFINANVGWVFSYTGNGTGVGILWKTTDGGATWATITYPAASTYDNQVYSADMVDANIGYIVTYFPKPWKTTDGGLTWTPQATYNAYTGVIYGISMLDANTGYMGGGSGNLYYTTDGGANWNGYSGLSTSYTFYDVQFLNANLGMAVTGSTGMTVLTTNGGTTWQPTGSGGATCYAVYMTPGTTTTNVFMGGTSGTVFKYSNLTIPVEMSAFTSSVTGNNVTLNWTVASELNNKGFDVERKSSTGEFAKIAFVNGKGTTTERSNYAFTDKNVNAGVYNYRIKQIDFDGTSKYYNLSEVVKVGVPDKFELSQNYPNPFNPSTVIKYAVPQSGLVKLNVFNSLGEVVTTLVNQNVEAGNYEVTFNASGLSSGVYFYKLESGSFSSVKKLMLIK